MTSYYILSFIIIIVSILLNAFHKLKNSIFFIAKAT